MEEVESRIVGNIEIIVYETSDGEKFFEIYEDNDDVIQISYIIEDILNYY